MSAIQQRREQIVDRVEQFLVGDRSHQELHHAVIRLIRRPVGQRLRDAEKANQPLADGLLVVKSGRLAMVRKIRRSSRNRMGILQEERFAETSASRSVQAV
jgi:hypothetical protein